MISHRPDLVKIVQKSDELTETEDTTMTGTF